MTRTTLRRAAWGLAATAAGGTAVAVALSGLPEVGLAPTGPGPGEDVTLLQVAARGGLDGTEIEPWRIHPEILGASDIAATDDGWVVLDARAAELHVLDASLRLRTTFGRPGDGPGELTTPAQVAVTEEGRVGVMDLSGRRLDLFTLEGEHEDRVRPTPPLCRSGGVVRDLLPGPGGGFVVDVDCTGRSSRDWIIGRVGTDGQSSRLATTPLAEPGRLALEPGRGAAVWRGRIMVGTSDGCIRPVSSASPPTARCLPPRPSVPIPASLRKRLEATARKAGDGRSIRVPRHLPPFLSMSGSPVGPVLSIPTSPDSGSLAILGPGGGLHLVEGVQRAEAGRGGLLLIRPFLEGTGFRSVPWSRLFGRAGLASPIPDPRGEERAIPEDRIGPEPVEGGNP